jgi:hypothetical protein
MPAADQVRRTQLYLFGIFVVDAHDVIVGIGFEEFMKLRVNSLRVPVFGHRLIYAGRLGSFLRG